MQREQERKQRQKFYEEIRAAAAQAHFQETGKKLTSSVQPIHVPQARVKAFALGKKTFPKRDIRGEFGVLYHCLTNGESG